MNKFKYKIGEK